MVSYIAPRFSINDNIENHNNLRSEFDSTWPIYSASTVTSSVPESSLSSVTVSLNTRIQGLNVRADPGTSKIVTCLSDKIVTETLRQRIWIVIYRRFEPSCNAKFWKLSRICAVYIKKFTSSFWEKAVWIFKTRTVKNTVYGKVASSSSGSDACSILLYLML